MNSKERKYLEKTLRKYEEKEFTKLDELKRLDRKVSKGANVFAYIFGTIGSLILGFGMCFAMNVIATGPIFMALGIVIGLIGILFVSVNYFIYKRILSNSRNKYSNQILELSSQLLND